MGEETQPQFPTPFLSQDLGVVPPASNHWVCKVQRKRHLPPHRILEVGGGAAEACRQPESALGAEETTLRPAAYCRSAPTAWEQAGFACSVPLRVPRRPLSRAEGHRPARRASEERQRSFAPSGWAVCYPRPPNPHNSSSFLFPVQILKPALLSSLPPRPVYLPLLVPCLSGEQVDSQKASSGSLDWAMISPHPQLLHLSLCQAQETQGFTGRSDWSKFLPAPQDSSLRPHICSHYEDMESIMDPFYRH